MVPHTSTARSGGSSGAGRYPARLVHDPVLHHTPGLERAVN